MGGEFCNYFEVSYDVPGKGNILEATVTKCKNGAVIILLDPYMRRGSRLYGNS